MVDSTPIVHRSLAGSLGQRLYLASAPASRRGHNPAPNIATQELAPASKPRMLDKGKYLENIEESNKKLQREQIQNWDEKRRGNSKGVEAGKALMK